MSMRVLLVGNYPADTQKSMAAFVAMMRRYLLDAGYSVEVLVPTSVLLPKNKVRPRGVWKWVGYLDKFIIFPFILRKKVCDFDIIHICDHSNAMYVLGLRGKSVVVTCHDVIAIEAARGLIPGWDVGRTGKLFQHLIFKGLECAEEVVCVSGYTQKHLQALGWKGKRSCVVLNALNADFHKRPAQEVETVISKAGLPMHGNYLLHVGSDLPRKNRLFAIHLLHLLRSRLPKLDLRLVFIGPMLTAMEMDFVETNNLQNSVLVINKATHDELSVFYSAAWVFVFPSLFEGFGWPLIEAQSCECAVFASGREPMTEVGGEGAIYFDPENLDAAVEEFISAMPDLEAWRRKGKINAERFMPEKFLNGYLAAYLRVLHGDVA